MKSYEQLKFTGERALFQEKEAQISYCTFYDRESPLKESADLTIDHTFFEWKYPLWYSKNVTVTDSTLTETARAAIWYTSHISMKDMAIAAPKSFRRCQDVTLENIHFSDAQETLWNCRNLQMKQISAKGEYFAMNMEDAEIDGLTLIGNYGFDGAKNLVIRNSNLITKDAFWNCENITIYDSTISGEYFGWNSKNITLINCTVESHQGFCYMENLVMKDCRLLHTDLAFEYSSVDVKLISHVESIKNPLRGKIQAKSIGEMIFDDEQCKKENVTLITEQ